MAVISIQRRHDLDALRAFAMLLGIALHAALSFLPFPWAVHDTRQNAWLGVCVEVVHGFRMPLFFLVSGFFTAMLWRRQGLKSLLKHRFRRVALPCLLGLLTIVPALRWVSGWAIASAQRDVVVVEETKAISDFLDALRQRDPTRVERFLAAGTDPNGRDARFGVTMLNWAAMCGDADATRLLIERGADVDGRNSDGSSALHGAAFLGHSAVAEVLIANGADPEVRNNGGDRPYDATSADWGTTQFIVNLLSIPPRSEEEVRAGREKCRELLHASDAGEQTARSDQAPSEPAADFLGIRSAYAALLTSDRFLVRWSATSEPFHLILSPVFDHLWFLWYLCWLVPLFAACVCVGQRCDWPEPPRRFLVSAVRYGWLLPLTMVPQWLMGTLSPSFGPDTFVGVLPPPHLLLYYGIFFAVGALYFDCDDRDGQLGRWWWLALPCALLGVFPAARMAIASPALSGFAQVTYAWLMTCGLIGLFRRLLTREYKTIRYVSDSSYWLYVAHLPLVIAGQHLIRKWPVPSELKFALLCTVVTAILLVSYQLLVRNTWLGVLLNGRRQKSTGFLRRAHVELQPAEDASSTDCRATS